MKIQTMTGSIWNNNSGTRCGLLSGCITLSRAVAADDPCSSFHSRHPLTPAHVWTRSEAGHLSFFPSGNWSGFIFKGPMLIDGGVTFTVRCHKYLRFYRLSGVGGTDDGTVVMFLKIDWSLIKKFNPLSDIQHLKSVRRHWNIRRHPGLWKFTSLI